MKDLNKIVNSTKKREKKGSDGYVLVKFAGRRISAKDDPPKTKIKMISKCFINFQKPNGGRKKRINERRNFDFFG